VPVCVQVIEKLAILMYSICAAKDSVLSCYKDTWIIKQCWDEGLILCGHISSHSMN